MKRLVALLFLFAGIYSNTYLSAQCTPGDAISCPDPENNGEVCPDSLPKAYLNQFYSQEFTILAPPEYTDSSSGITVDLHHIEIQDVGNLPTGLTWVSNAEDSVFLVGEYYCVLMDGTPTEKGLYPLHIVVDVYIPGILGSPPIYAATITDSTALTIEVLEESSIGDLRAGSDLKMNILPNPFVNATEVLFFTSDPGEIKLEIYDLTGKRIYVKKILTQAGENRIFLNTEQFEPGIYFCSAITEYNSIVSKLVKTE